MKCTRHHECIRQQDHDEMCRKLDGTVILRRREPAIEAQIAEARAMPNDGHLHAGPGGWHRKPDCTGHFITDPHGMSRCSGCCAVAGALSSAEQVAWMRVRGIQVHVYPGGSFSVGADPDNHVVTEADAHLAARADAKMRASMPTDMDRAMGEVDTALGVVARHLRTCAHAIFNPGCASCEEEKAYALRDGVGWARGVASTRAGQMAAVADAAASGHMTRETARKVIDDTSPITPRRNATWTSGPVFAVNTGKVLTTNHPEVTDPAERARLGLEPLDVMEEAARRVHGAGAREQNGVFDLERVEPLEVPHAFEAGDPAIWGPKCRLCNMLPTAQRHQPVTTLLDGEDHAAFEAFGAACAALEDHAQQTQALQTNYRAALERVSQMAARRKRGTP